MIRDEREIDAAMAATGFDRMQAVNHLRQMRADPRGKRPFPFADREDRTQ